MSQADFALIYDPIRTLSIDYDKFQRMSKNELATHLTNALKALKQAEVTIIKQSDVIMASNEALVKLANKETHSLAINNNNNTQTEVTNMIQNEFEIERKKQNVCVYGLKENVDKSDSELMIEIANFLEIDNAQNMIMEATRAGRTDDPE